METSFKYELKIKGRDAKIGSNLFVKKYGKYFNIRIEEVGFNNDGVYVMYYNIDTDSNGIMFDISKLSWEKPTTYQLPDTKGNLSEVNVGQKVWVKNDDGRIWGASIIENKDCRELNQCKINGDCIVVRYDTGHATHFNNITGVNHNGRLKITTNKPHRDFSRCPHWEENPDALYWGIDSNGYSYWYYSKPIALIDIGMWDVKKYCTAGYRADLINQNGIVEGWEYSLVERPKE